MNSRMVYLNAWLGSENTVLCKCKVQKISDMIEGRQNVNRCLPEGIRCFSTTMTTIYKDGNRFSGSHPIISDHPIFKPSFTDWEQSLLNPIIYICIWYHKIYPFLSQLSLGSCFLDLKLYITCWYCIKQV